MVEGIAAEWDRGDRIFVLIGRQPRSRVPVTSSIAPWAILLLVASVIGVLARRLHVPYSVGLGVTEVLRPYRNLMVPRCGIEPPTRGFSVRTRWF